MSNPTTLTELWEQTKQRIAATGREDIQAFLETNEEVAYFLFMAAGTGAAAIIFRTLAQDGTMEPFTADMQQALARAEKLAAAVGRVM